MRFPRTLFLAALAVFVAVPASAQDNEWEEEAAFQMSVAEAFANSVGFELDDMTFSSLDEGESESWNFTARNGVDYRIIALCDRDCSDIDLYLEDRNGNEIDSDISLNDAPILSVSGRGDQYRIRVRMYSCDIEPCYFAVGVFAR